MAWPANHWLPAIAISEWSAGTDPRFYWMMFKQLEGVRKMYNERRTAAGLSTLGSYTTPLLRMASTINALRTGIEEMIGQYIDHVNTYPNGNIEGTTTTPTTKWTRANLLAAISGGVSGNWTRVPARAGSPTGGALQVGDQCYREHINELYQVMQLLQYVDIGCTASALSVWKNAEGAWQGNCNDAKNSAETTWDAASWSGRFGQIVAASAEYTPDSVSFRAKELNGRATLSYNLSRFSGLSAICKMYLSLVKYGNYATGGGPPYAPHNQAENVWGEWVNSGIVAGTSGVTNYLEGSDFKFPFQSNCPLGGNYTIYGWQISDSTTDTSSKRIIAKPSFAYT